MPRSLGKHQFHAQGPAWSSVDLTRARSKEGRKDDVVAGVPEMEKQSRLPARPDNWGLWDVSRHCQLSHPQGVLCLIE